MPRTDTMLDESSGYELSIASSRSALDEQALTSWLAKEYEGTDRYRGDRRKYGLTFELQVRVGLGNDTEWRPITLRYQSPGARGDAMERIAAGHGLYGAQAAAGRLRAVRAVTL